MIAGAFLRLNFSEEESYYLLEYLVGKLKGYYDSSMRGINIDIKIFYEIAKEYFPIVIVFYCFFMILEKS